MKKINYGFLTQVSASLLALSLAFIFNFFVLSFLTYSADQVRMQNAFASQVSNATAPIAEKDFQGELVKDGSPVARLVIDQIDLDVIVVEGTDSNTMRSGVGHRRDTVLPGQEGMTVLFGRTWSYGAPFGEISKLQKGDVFTVYTGQGKSEYKVSGIRKAGDKGLAPVRAGTNQLVLTAAEGEFFSPTGVVRVDAELIGTAFETGLRTTKWGEIPAESRELGIDTRFVWVLLIDLIVLLLAQVAAIWFASRFGRVKTWLVFAPGLILVLVLTIDQTTRLLPNLI
jgi:LPXTG-site transpeptidase (sortase) family protein